MIKINDLPDLEYLKTILKYDENSLSGLVWLVSKCYKPIGSVAGSIQIDKRNGYMCWSVGINKKIYPVHRIVWSLCNNICIDVCLEIDHINQNSLDNRFENLRVVDRTNNVINVNVKSNNKSGITGVHYDSHKNVWVSVISINKRKINLNTFNNIEDAICCRFDNVIKHYHPDHITIQILSIKDTHPEIYKKYEQYLNQSIVNQYNETIYTKLINQSTYKEYKNFCKDELEHAQLSSIKLIVEYIKTNNKFPSKSSKDRSVAVLGYKLSNLRKLYNNSTIDTKIYKNSIIYLKSVDMLHILEFEDLVTHQIKQIKDIVSFICDNNYTPDKNSKNIYEKKLGQKLSQLKHAYNNPEKSSAKIYKETIDYLSSVNMLSILTKKNIL